MSENRRILFFDATLRDGLQGEPINLSLDDRITLFELIDETGVDYIESGFPAASAVDLELTSILSRRRRNSKLSFLTRPTKADIELTMAALHTKENVQAQLLLTGSENHLKNKRKMSPLENIREMENGIDLLRSHGIEDITAGFEDASRTSIEFLKRSIDVCIKRGATTLVLPDTMGYFIPEECFEFVSTLKGFVGNDAKLSIHVHNDFGLATANSLAAIRAGIDCVQGTFCGIGERAGNASIEEIVSVLHYKKDFYGVHSGVKLDTLYPLYQKMKEVMKLPPSFHKPIFGDHVFSTFAGIHIDGITKDRSTYEYLNPELFGRSWQLLINGNLGKSLIVHKLKQMELEMSEKTISLMFNEIKSSKDPTQYNNTDVFVKLHAVVSESVT